MLSLTTPLSPFVKSCDHQGTLARQWDWINNCTTDLQSLLAKSLHDERPTQQPNNWGKEPCSTPEIAPVCSLFGACACQSHCQGLFLLLESPILPNKCKVSLPKASAWDGLWNCCVRLEIPEECVDNELFLYQKNAELVPADKGHLSCLRDLLIFK